MNATNRRYVFIDFENLRKTKFKKLEKICDKLFVFINAREKNVPLRLVLQMQHFGKNAKWIAIDEPSIEYGMNYHIAFVMGKLHEKVSKEIEFAVLSNDDSFDPLVMFINQSGNRSCLRVQRKTKNGEEQSSFSLADEMAIPLSPPEPAENRLELTTIPANFEPLEQVIEQAVEEPVFQYQENKNTNNDKLDIIERTAEETVQRLIRSGNRPALVSTLKNYILLHNQKLTGRGNIDKVIEQLETTNDIEVHEGEVLYHF